MPTVEDRLADIERMLALGIGGHQGEVDRLNAAVGRLRSERVSGNIFGGMIRTEIGPSFSYIGPYERDVDSTHHLTFTLPIPEYILRISRCMLHAWPKPVRSSVAVGSSGAVTPSGGGSTAGPSSTATTLSDVPVSGGGSTAGASTNDTSDTTTTPSQSSSTSGSSGHAHQQRTVSTFTSSGNGPDPHNHGYIEPDNVTYTETPLHSHSVPSHTHPAHDHGMAHTHSTPNHLHTAHQHGMDHVHSTPNHTHPSHTHDLTLAIAEGGQATQQQIWIDGVNRTAELGGPWDGECQVDIRPYLIDAHQIPLYGDHIIQFRSATIGAIEVTGDIYVIVRPPV